MLTTRHHNSHDYAMLPDIDAADAGRITNDDQACLGEIGDCLLRTGLTHALALLFSIVGFQLMTTRYCSRRFRPKRTQSLYGRFALEPWGLSATNVCFDDADARGGGLRLVGLEFAPNRALAGVAPIREFDGNVLASLAEILRRYGGRP